MLKKTITFKDLDDKDVTEDFYFNLSEAELTEMELSKKDGMVDYLQRLVASEDGAEIMATFKMILMMSIGKRSEDNRRFIKNDQIREDFVSSNAYSVLFMEMVTNAEAGSEFIRGVVPKSLQDNIETVGTSAISGEAKDERPAWIREDRDPTPAEIRAMPPAQLAEAFQKKVSG